ncbi:hypothetical protein COV24_05170 [candidate division WWE3 bacterium CG10_big_fil_rev_8_21_14_0_10_32_10]|uniref:Uncharacterized protein n=1 Tax=candidate division WWE3 bacterium CG10_big_fil_rev_8_21_14_0_10_32_10 TaxID=1975090 RepID=A0A2H0RAE8_UNCKA|nr:MAG: hypothetical protein COV24_05170 [candidate division WWE3 bacterium CG10_big_fil_rev_8_21_14_0_10_32_10]
MKNLLENSTPWVFACVFLVLLVYPYFNFRGFLRNAIGISISPKYISILLIIILFIIFGQLNGVYYWVDFLISLVIVFGFITASTVKIKYISGFIMVTSILIPVFYFFGIRSFSEIFAVLVFLLIIIYIFISSISNFFYKKVK